MQEKTEIKLAVDHGWIMRKKDKEQFELLFLCRRSLNYGTIAAISAEFISSRISGSNI